MIPIICHILNNITECLLQRYGSAVDCHRGRGSGCSRHGYSISSLGGGHHYPHYRAARTYTGLGTNSWRAQTDLTHSSTEYWIKDLLSMAPPIRTRPSFPLSQSLPSRSFHKPLILLHQRADRLKTIITEK